MDTLDSQTALAIATAIAAHSIASPISEFPQELYILPYICFNALLFYHLSTQSITYDAIFHTLTTTNATFLLTSALLTIGRRVFFSPLSKYPGPKTAAITGLWNANEARLGRIPRTYKALHEQHKSDVIRVGPNEVSVRNCDALSKLYKGKHPRGTFNQVFNLVGGDTIATVRDYDRHTLWRRIWDKSLSGTEIPKYIERMKTHLVKTISTLHGKNGAGVETGKLFDGLVYDVLADLTFSRDIGLQSGRGDGPVLLDLLHKFVRFAGVVGHLPTLQQIFRYLPTSADGRKVNLIGHRLIAERQALVTEHKDFFAHFSSSGVFTPEELKLQALTVITAGADTVSKALNQLFALLASRPDIQERIRQEMGDAFDGEGVPPSEVLKRLEYLEAVIKEGLRMFPPLFRGAPAMAPKGGVTLNTGDFIPANTQVWISQYLVMTDERNFPRADEFLPERWLSEGEKLVNDRRAWFPFGNGAHSCPGKGLAMAELRFIIAYFLREFDVSFEEKEGQLFSYEKWAANWKDMFAVEMEDLYLKFTPRTAAAL